MTSFIDTHAHLDFDEFKDNFDEVLEKLKENNIEKVIIPGVTIQDTPRILEYVEKYDILYAALGIHPSEAKTWNDKSYDYFKSLMSHPKVVAIGEIGLDYYWDKSFNDIQQEVLKQQIKLAQECNKPIVIHDRDAHFDCLNILKELQAKDVVFHCFSGSVEFMNECLKEGYYIALGGVVTFKNSVKAKEVAKLVPLDRLLLETDSPYLTPVPYRGKTNCSYYIPLIAQEIANIKEIDIEELAVATTQNANKLFHF